MGKSRYVNLPEGFVTLKREKKQKPLVRKGEKLVLHDYAPQRFLDYILLPYGPFYMTHYHKIRHGTKIRFMTGETAKVENAITISAKSGMAEVLCKMKYNVSIETLFRRLDAQTLLNGQEDCLDKSKLILLTYKAVTRNETDTTWIR